MKEIKANPETELIKNFIGNSKEVLFDLQMFSKILTSGRNILHKEKGEFLDCE